MGGYDTPGWAWGLALDGNLLYVADKSKGMVILDVSDPSAPKKAGGYPNMKNTKTIQIEDTLAYVADGPDRLWILNIRDPQKPTVVSKFNVEGYAYSAFKSGNTVFVSNESGQRLEMVNIRDIKHPRKEADYQAGANVYASWKNDVILYVAADKEMQILKYNRAPVIEPIANQQVDEMQQLTVVPDAYDPDKNPIYFSVKNLPEGAEFDTLTGTLTWTPNYEQSGLYPEITIIVTERTSSSLSSQTQFDIDVKHVNRNPSLPEMEDYTIKENEEITIVVPEGSDPDIEDKGRLTYSCDDLPEGAVFDSTTSTFTWTPNYDQSGVYTIPFSVHDGAGGIATQTSTVTVLHVDRKPVLEAVPPQTVDENQQLTIQLKGSDPDKEDQDKLIEIQEAYEVLSDKKKREKYDKELKKIEKERRIEYPQEFYFEIVISPLEARYGKRINIEIPIMKRCPRCLGEVDPFCPICNGEGFLWDYYYKSLILPCGIRNGATIRFSLKDAGIDVWINLRVFISSFFI